MKLDKVLVCGGRRYADFQFLYAKLCKLQERTGFSILVHGAAPGADTLAGRWAGGRLVEVRAYPADWGRLGTRAGPIRNRAMYVAERPDAVVAFPGGNGTEGMKRIARQGGTPVMLPSRALP